MPIDFQVLTRAVFEPQIRMGIVGWYPRPWSYFLAALFWKAKIKAMATQKAKPAKMNQAVCQSPKR